MKFIYNYLISVKYFVRISSIALFIFTVGILSFLSCNSSVASDSNDIMHIDMNKVQGQLKFECDSALNVRDMQYTALRDSYNLATSYKCQEDSLREALFIAKYKIEGVKKYLRICDKNPTQKKFLIGWIHRAID